MDFSLTPEQESLREEIQGALVAVRRAEAPGTCGADRVWRTGIGCAVVDALRTHGGAGLSSDCELQRALRDATASVFYSGTSDIQRSIIARWLGL